MGHSLRIVFAGTPEFASQHLQALIDSRHKVVAVYTQPDKPSGRGRKLSLSAVKKTALTHELPLYQPASLADASTQDSLKLHQPDVMVVVAYGLLLPSPVLDIPRYGCINVHGSLLPRWRGAAPVQRAVIAGDKKTGITVMQMDCGLDTGDMLHKLSVPILNSDTSATLYDKLSRLGSIALKEVLDQISTDTVCQEKQDNDLATYAHKITKEEGRVDWSLPAEKLSCLIRGLNPWPVAWTELQGMVVRLWDIDIIDNLPSDPLSQVVPGTIVHGDKSSVFVACGQQALSLKSIQLPGKRRMDIRDVLNSRRDMFTAGKVFQ